MPVGEGCIPTHSDNELTFHPSVLGPTRIIDLLEKYRTAEGLYFYLGGIVNISEDKDVTFKYIEAATKMGQLNEVERVCRESNFYGKCPSISTSLSHQMACSRE